MQRAIFMLVLTAALSLPALAASQQRTARVAQGQVVKLADSQKSVAEWARLRPHWDQLRPGKTR